MISFGGATERLRILNAYNRLLALAHITSIRVFQVKSKDIVPPRSLKLSTMLILVPAEVKLHWM